MENKVVKVVKLPHFKGQLPKYESQGASGLDVRAAIEKSIFLKPGDRALVPTGIAMEIPLGFEIQVRPRSGLAFKQGISVINTPGTIDADYRGELKIALINLGSDVFEIKDQERIAQIVLAPVVGLQWQEVSELSSTNRGAGGFGSTGV